jgi:hypothetical protein
VKKKVVSKRKTKNKKPNTGAIAGLVTIIPSGRTTKGEFLKTAIEKQRYTLHTDSTVKSI